jgi:uncharacterized protein (TIGR02266 family)
VSPGRKHQRIPCGVKVEFRSASAFLISYATNLSRGGMFLETVELPQVGTDLSLSLEVPGHGVFAVPARVAWTRGVPDQSGPRGIGLEFAEVAADVGRVIDRLIGAFEGIQVALLSRDGRSSVAVGRAIRAAITTAEIVEISEVSLLEAVCDDCELVVIDADSEPDGGDKAVAAVRGMSRPLPAIVLSAVSERRERAEAAGAIALRIPPAAGELGKAALTALSQPIAVEVDVER